jgi:hypothetical protein
MPDRFRQISLTRHFSRDATLRKGWEGRRLLRCAVGEEREGR